MNKRLKSLLLVTAPALILGASFFAFRWGPHGRARLVLQIVLPWGLILVLVALAGFRLPDTFFAKWTKAHGVEITDLNRDVVRRYLLRGRRIRTAGGLAGLIGYTIWASVVMPNRSGLWWIVATF